METIEEAREWIWTQEETKRRLGESPDRADALILMLWAARGNVKVKQDYSRWNDLVSANANEYGWDAPVVAEGGWEMNTYN